MQKQKEAAYLDSENDGLFFCFFFIQIQYNTEFWLPLLFCSVLVSVFVSSSGWSPAALVIADTSQIKIDCR